MLLVVVLGVMSGHQGYREMEYFVKANEVILKRTFNIYSQGMPSYSTIRRVMRGVDEKDLSKIVKEWSRENSPKLNIFILEKNGDRSPFYQVAIALSLLFFT